MRITVIISLIPSKGTTTAAMGAHAGGESLSPGEGGVQTSCCCFLFFFDKCTLYLSECTQLSFQRQPVVTDTSWWTTVGFWSLITKAISKACFVISWHTLLQRQVWGGVSAHQYQGDLALSHSTSGMCDHCTSQPGSDLITCHPHACLPQHGCGRDGSAPFHQSFYECVVMPIEAERQPSVWASAPDNLGPC